MQETKEEWRDIEEYENLYQISNLGIVKSLGNDRTRKEKILRPQKVNNYLIVSLSKDGKAKHYYIHRLVALHFIPNPQNLEQINHRDEDKTNNCVSNLEFCTAAYNINYGTRNQRSAEKTSKQVLCVETGIIYSSTKEVQRQLGFAHNNISQCCNGKYKTAYGYTWKYISKTMKVRKQSQETKEKIAKANRIPIVQLSKEDNFIKQWESAKQAGEELGIYPSSIRSCCKGRLKTAGGFKWNYLQKN